MVETSLHERKLVRFDILDVLEKVVNVDKKVVAAGQTRAGSIVVGVPVGIVAVASGILLLDLLCLISNRWLWDESGDGRRRNGKRRGDLRSVQTRAGARTPGTGQRRRE